MINPMKICLLSLKSCWDSLCCNAETKPSPEDPAEAVKQPVGPLLIKQSFVTDYGSIPESRAGGDTARSDSPIFSARSQSDSSAQALETVPRKRPADKFMEMCSEGFASCDTSNEIETPPFPSPVATEKHSEFSRKVLESLLQNESDSVPLDDSQMIFSWESNTDESDVTAVSPSFYSTTEDEMCFSEERQKSHSSSRGSRSQSRAGYKSDDSLREFQFTLPWEEQQSPASGKRSGKRSKRLTRPVPNSAKSPEKRSVGSREDPEAQSPGKSSDGSSQYLSCLEVTCQESRDSEDTAVEHVNLACPSPVHKTHPQEPHSPPENVKKQPSTTDQGDIHSSQ